MFQRVGVISTGARKVIVQLADEDWHYVTTMFLAGSREIGAEEASGEDQGRRTEASEDKERKSR